MWRLRICRSIRTIGSSGVTILRRLDAEEIRDATLAAAGQLDLSRTKGSPAMDLPVIELANNGPQARRLAAAAAASRHRSVYLPLLRGLTPNSLAVFDFAEQGMVTGARHDDGLRPRRSTCSMIRLCESSPRPSPCGCFDPRD